MMMVVTLCGCVDKHTYRTILPTIYKTIIICDKFILAGEDSDHYAIFDYSGKRLTPFEYTFWTNYIKISDNYSVIHATKKNPNKKWADYPLNISSILLDLKRKPLPPLYDRLSYINFEGNLPDYKMLYAAKDGKCRLLDSVGKILIPIEYDQIYTQSFDNNSFVARKTVNGE